MQIMSHCGIDENELQKQFFTTLDSGDIMDNALKAFAMHNNLTVSK